MVYIVYDYSRCKDEGVLEVRYYCSRECQGKMSLFTSLPGFDLFYLDLFSII